MSDLAWHEISILGVYMAILACLAVYGLYRYYMVLLYYWHKRGEQPVCEFDPQNAPSVTVQLPIFNEYYVAERLIGAVASFDYPREKLQIQVLDDSTDETRDVVREVVERHRAAGVNIEHIHREDRVGYKAGALANGMKTSTGEFIAIFDADFLPKPDTLRRVIPRFEDPKLGMAQMRWEHINRDSSLLTRLQAMCLDGHFVIEQFARSRSGRFFNFNGTGGVWRRQAIEDAGGWQHDTLTEDLDLSYRAQLAGWRFAYLHDVTAPGEVPVDVNGFKSQQHRWTKGSMQTGLKLLGRIWRAGVPLKVKIEATIHLTHNLPYLLMLLLSLILWPALAIRMEHGLLGLWQWDIPLLIVATVSHAIFFICAQIEIRRGFVECLLHVPAMMALGIGLSINNSKAILEGLFGGVGEFVRTAKYGAGDESMAWSQNVKYFARRSWLPGAEVAMGLYFTAVFAYAWANGQILLLPFLLLFMSGYLYLGLLSFAQRPIATLLSRKTEPGVS